MLRTGPFLTPSVRTAKLSSVKRGLQVVTSSENVGLIRIFIRSRKFSPLPPAAGMIRRLVKKLRPGAYATS
jgi:hypothetical protein